MKLKTKLIHGGITGDEQTGAVNVPIYQVSTYKQDAIGRHKGFEYSRTGNPTRLACEELMQDIEGGVRGFAFSSGMAAISAVVMLYEQGSHFVISNDVYGGTYRVMSNVFDRFGIEVSYVDTSDLEQVKEAIQANTKAIFVETPTNPLLKVSDMTEISKICRKHDLHLVVDNTFMTPYWQNPLQLGADIVLHSATKYLGGHSDVVAGVVVVNDVELGEALHHIQNSTGGVLGPQDAWLLIRGVKTLAVRMHEHEQNTQRVVHYLQKREDIGQIYYPGLEDHPGHEVQVKQSRGFGGMFSFDVGSGERAEKVLSRVQYFTLAESLGAVESLISVPAQMTHASIPADRREELGITDGLIRVSIGLEDADDLIADLDQALA